MRYFYLVRIRMTSGIGSECYNVVGKQTCNSYVEGNVVLPEITGLCCSMKIGAEVSS